MIKWTGVLAVAFLASACGGGGGGGSGYAAACVKGELGTKAVCDCMGKELEAQLHPDTLKAFSMMRAGKFKEANAAMDGRPPSDRGLATQAEVAAQRKCFDEMQGR